MRKINGAGYALRLSGIELVGGGQSTAKLAALHSSIQAALVGVEVDKILDKLKGISMDDTVTEEERAQLSATWAQIQSVYSSLAQQSADLGFTDEGSARYGAWIAAKTAFDNLSAVLAPILAGSGDQTADGGALYEAFQKFYQASGILGQAISSELYDQEYKIVMSLDSYEFLYNGRGKPVDPSASISVKVKTTGIVGTVILSYNGQDHTLVDGSYVIPISDMGGRTQILVTATATDTQTKKSYSATALIAKRVSQPARPILVNDGNYTIGNPPATTREGALIEGDYFLDKDTNIPYSYIDGSWIPTTSSIGNWYDVLRDTLPIAISSDKTITSGSFIYAWIQMLAADSAFIKNLFAQEIELGQNESGGGGRIFSHNYLTSNGKEGWLLDYNGNGVFRDVYFSGVNMVDGSISIRGSSGSRVLETINKTSNASFKVNKTATHYLCDDVLAAISLQGFQSGVSVSVDGYDGTGYVLCAGEEVVRVDTTSFIATNEGVASGSSALASNIRVPSHHEIEARIIYASRLSLVAPVAGRYTIKGRQITGAYASGSKLTVDEGQYENTFDAAKGQKIEWIVDHGLYLAWVEDSKVSGNYDHHSSTRGSTSLPTSYASCQYRCVLPVTGDTYTRLFVFNESFAGGVKRTALVGGTPWTGFLRDPDGGNVTNFAGGAFCICYGNGMFVGGGDEGHIFTADRSRVTRVFYDQGKKPPFLSRIVSICYGGGRFVACDQSGIVGYADNPTGSWIRASVTLAGKTMKLCYGGGKFLLCACGPFSSNSTGNLSAYSSDGATWTAVGNPALAGGVYAICYGGGRFVAVTQFGKSAVSVDGVNWTVGGNVPISIVTQVPLGLCYGGGSYIVGTRDSTTLAYSEDGLSWIARTISVLDDGVYSICYGGGRFVTCLSSRRTYYSYDGKTWRRDTSQIQNDGDDLVGGICYGADLFVLCTWGTYGGTKQVARFASCSATSPVFLNLAEHPVSIALSEISSDEDLTGAQFARYLDGRSIVDLIPKGKHFLVSSTAKIVGSDGQDMDGAITYYSMTGYQLELVAADGTKSDLNLDGVLKMTSMNIVARYEVLAEGLYAETMSAGNFLGQIAKFCWKDNPLPGWLACDGTQPINSHYPLYNVIKNKGSDGFEYNEESDYYTITTGDANTYIYAGIPDL